MKYTHNPGKRCQFSKHLRVGKISKDLDDLPHCGKSNVQFTMYDVELG